MEPPPRPPPHGQSGGGTTGGGGTAGGASGLPPGKYDIFVIPPHSAGSGFLYLPSLQPHRNSFLAGVACTLAAVSLWSVVLPALKEWVRGIAGGSSGMGALVMMGGVGIVGWAWGRTQAEGDHSKHGGGGGAGTGTTGGGTGGGAAAGPGSAGGAGASAFGAGNPSTPPPKSSWQRQKPADTGAKGAWEKARDEARRREDERKRAEELRKKADELLKKRADEERERVRLREKEARERREREAREKASQKRPPQPTARTEADEDAYSFRPYDAKPKPAATAKTTSSGSVYSEAWDARSHSTRQSTPPPSARRGPYHTKDPDKIVIKAVYAFGGASATLPAAQLVSGQRSVTDGLILRITTEGLFIDDDVRGVPQREWDVKAWTMKLVESGDMRGLHVLRATIRDAEGKRYVFVLGEEEGWKVAMGLQRLRRGTQVRSLGVSGLAPNETKAILSNMGFL